jgi:hypothetical protein
MFSRKIIANDRTSIGSTSCLFRSGILVREHQVTGHAPLSHIETSQLAVQCREHF